ncbi:uncharacterized protein LOC124922332 [Impatiens glandulifera]|uniref:uncharacterized protein LOC124922332 n=1 Tax=Impatiens glandulifera TaxID=253017 RepID=UPI001FB19222|nr:uncharacterized protein LOC124922332 [Impatiens glandulifera]
MFRAFSTRRYERLGGAGDGGIDHHHHHYQPSSLGGGDMFNAKLRRVTSLPVKFLTSASRKVGSDSNFVNSPTKPTVNSPAKPTAAAKKAAGKVHPILSLLDPRRRKKATAKPEFARYLQYLKEGGVWDAKSDKPSIY